MLDNKANHPVQNKTIYLKDYQAPAFEIDRADLQFQLIPNRTLVTATLELRRTGEEQDLILDGEALELLEISINDQTLTSKDYSYADNKLTLPNVPSSFTLSTTVAIEPEKNTQLSGLYQSSGNYCTQCEAEGFRRITFFLDRPDVLSVFSVKIIADKADFPVLLSNGNPQESGDLDNGKHFAIWHDPHPKPSYLFALVAGKLFRVTDSFVTMNNRQVELNVYAESHNIDKCDYALGALVRSMEWDEKVYGREYDLDIYNVVAVDDFNMGAMENKGLNVFNSKYVLAVPETATDTDFEGIESVIGHEYFHNWSGNRVTCRDWFQLSLKEGFTVFRDQEFSADMGSRGVKRINDVNILRTHQFKEDAGPMAHPVRPASYQEINNFYTVTVYNKGAEVLRMLHTLLGEKKFRAGTDLYFDRHDGQAVTTDDFVQALQDASGKNLSQFRRWYSQAGTPVLDLSEKYENETYTLTVTQSCPDTPDGVKKRPFHLPLCVRLLDIQGKELLPETVLELTEQRQEFVFENIISKPVLSFLRGYSAPVKVQHDVISDDLDTLIQFDNDPFVRWESMQQRVLPELLAQYKNGQVAEIAPNSIVRIISSILSSSNTDNAMLAELLTLPSESYLSDFCHPIQPTLLRDVRENFANQLAYEFEDKWLQLYQENHSFEYELNGEEVGKRALKNLCLSYLSRLDKDEYFDLAKAQLDQADNMTDSISALSILVNSSYADKSVVLRTFYERWKDNALVLDKWFSLQASAKSIDTFDQVKVLFDHPAFSLKNPNKVRALLGAFAQNLGAFHGTGKEAYEFYIDKMIELDGINAQVAARMVSVFNQWKTFDKNNAEAIKKQLERLNNLSPLSKDVAEIVGKALN